MRASELTALAHRMLASCCAASVSLSTLPPPGFAVDLAGGSGAQVAQQRRETRRRDRSDRPARPAGSSRYPRGSAAGALSRPAPGFHRGNRRPSGGWVDRTPPGSLRPSPYPLRPGPGMGGINPQRPRPDWNRPGWNRPNWMFNRPVVINNFNARPAWWGPTWPRARPWRYGWYNGGYNRWSWWNSSSLIWGITSLASAAIIGAAINDAIRQNQPTIAVKDSPYQLVYGSVRAIGSDEVVFSFLFGDTSYEARANCRAGTINGRQPMNPEEAQLMNAACQVAFSDF